MKNPSKIFAQSPTRVDFAGGTIDIYPLYIFENEGLTINAAIEIYNEVEITRTSKPGISIISETTGEKIYVLSKEKLNPLGRLGFLARIVRFYLPQNEGFLEIKVKHQAPKGSGLGGSSSLLIALSFALNRLIGEKYSSEEIINIGANLEAQEIRIPTGKQDYYAAVYGGINAIWFRVDKNEVESLYNEEIIKNLESRIILSFTGISRASAITNWQMLKNYIDGKKETISNLKTIKSIAFEMRDALRGGDLKSFGKLLKKEWEARKKMAKNVTNAKIEKIIKGAESLGAIGSKVCGAGAGGFMITFVPIEKKEIISSGIEKLGAKVVKFKISKKGTEVFVNN